MRGKVLFYLPSDLETLLAAIAVIQGFVRMKHEQLKHSAVKVMPEIWVCNVNPDLIGFLPALGEHHTINECYSPSRLEFDLVFHFDRDVAYKLAVAAEMHITQSFGVQLGIPPPPIPDLSMLRVATSVVDVGMYDFDGREELKVWLVQAHPDKSWKDMTSADSPSQARLVIGLQSAATYLACAIIRDVVELVPAGKHPRWLSKWSHPGYIMIYGYPVSVDQIKKAVGALWARSGVAVSEVCK